MINFATNEELLLTGALLMAACYVAGALSSLLAWWSGRLALGAGHLAALAGALAGLGVSVGVLLGDPGRTLTQPLPVVFPFARLSLSVDGLSAYFLFVISLVAVAASIYGPAYLRAHSPNAGRARQAAQVIALNVFLGCMAFVCCAGDALSFLLCWEGMTLASYVLVVSDDRDGENARAGLLYMVMAHGGTALLLVAFLALTERAGAFDFTALRMAAGGLDSATRTTLFFLALGGFATCRFPESGFKMQESIGKAGRRVRNKQHISRVNDFYAAAPRHLDGLYKDRFLVTNDAGKSRCVNDGTRRRATVDVRHDPFRIANSDASACHQRPLHYARPSRISAMTSETTFRCSITSPFSSNIVCIRPSSPLTFADPAAAPRLLQ